METASNFEDVLNSLRHLDESSVNSDGLSLQLLEIEKSLNRGNEAIYISGNASGLVHFARLVMEVAAKGFVGAHQHFDEAGNVDRCDVPLVVRFKPAEWDE